MNSKKLINLPAAMLAACICLSFSACNNDDSSKTVTTDTSGVVTTDDPKKPSDLKPKMAKPDWGKDLDDPMAAVIEKLTAYKAPPIPTLSAEEARMQPTPADAATDIMKENNIPMPAPQCDTAGKEIPVAGGSIHARIYTPKTGKDSYPVIVYYHGGGWVIATIDTYNASAQGLCEGAEAVVVSVEYRKAPEHKFPTAHNDAYAAYEWVLKNAASIKGDPKKVAVAGESAGGNLAANVSMMARDKGAQLPLYQVLVYPVAAVDMTTPSYKESDSTKPLNVAMMKWFGDKYFRTPADGMNPMISLINANLKGMPPTTIIAAQYDPLRSEGQTLSDRLKAAGVSVNYKLYDGTTHEFFGMAAVVPDAKDAQGVAISDLKGALK